MGLLSHIEEADYNNTKSVSSVSFDEFQNNYTIDFFGIFTKIDKTYVLSKSFGFDFETITRMVFDSEVVDDLIIFENRIYSFDKTENNILNLFDKFSIDLQKIITKICFYKKSGKLYLICADGEKNIDFTEAFEKAFVLSDNAKTPLVSQNKDFYIYNFDFSDCIDNLCKDYDIQTLKDCIFSQILFNFYVFFPKPNKIKLLDCYNIEVYIMAKTEISKDLLLMQIKSNLENLLSSSVEYIKII